MTTTDEIKHKVSELIELRRKTGEFRLPAERQLCEEWGTSRVTLGKAITFFVSEGILERRQGDGTYVVDDSSRKQDRSVGVLLRRRLPVNDPHFNSIISGIASKADELGIDLQIFDQVIEQFHGKNRRNRVAKAIEGGNVDGLIVISRMPLDILATLAHGVPTVAINQYLHSEEVFCSNPDYATAGYQAVVHLLSKGHDRIGFACVDPSRRHITEWLTGANLALKAAGKTAIGIEYVLRARGRGDVVKKQAARMLEEGVTGFITQDDRVACWLVDVIASTRIEPARRLSIVGWGELCDFDAADIDYATFNPRWDLISGRALDVLNNLIDGVESPVNISDIEGELVEK